MVTHRILLDLERIVVAETMRSPSHRSWHVIVWFRLPHTTVIKRHMNLRALAEQSFIAGLAFMKHSKV